MGVIRNGVEIQPDNSLQETAHSDSKPPEAAWWVYLLACTDGRTYVGVALDVAARFHLHLKGKGAKFTRSNPPVAILGARPFADKSAALQAEYALKQLGKAEKLQWAGQWPYA